ncbi:metal-sulfur cluster assembly factor [Companilactobacillus jidongensis]|uniref:metal-sulfur cluster assembly factor n=1 Tax=Companilactobacillus jidongensis TaxID=2486006 RepID=UPI000F783E43|nr:iron-sulfur cluster assembly protein [Companilactobacillus jidongensis]
MDDKILIIRKQLSAVIDPDMEIDIINLGLIYSIELTNKICNIEMTMPTRSCQFGESMTQNVIKIVEDIGFVTKCNAGLDKRTYVKTSSNDTRCIKKSVSNLEADFCYLFF